MASILLKKICFDNLEPAAETMHIGFGVNNSYVRPMATAIASIRENLFHKRGLVVHVSTDGIDDGKLKRLKKMSEMLGIRINIYIIDTKDFDAMPKSLALPAANYFRLALPEVIDEEVDKLFYFDADVVALRSVNELFELEFEQDEIVMAVSELKDVEAKSSRELGLEDHVYFNAGVLIINMKLWHKEGIYQKVLKILRENTVIKDNFIENALNIALAGRVKYLAEKYNYINGAGINLESVVIMHYIGNPKPWKFYFPISEACNEFNKYAYSVCEKSTPWAAVPLDDPSNYEEMAECAKCLRKMKMYSSSLKWKWRAIKDKMNKK